jgi:hypothetical protein
MHHTHSNVLLGFYVYRYSNLTCSNNLGDNPAEEQLFQKRSEPLHIGADGSVKLTVHPEEIYTLTTLKTGGKGVAPKPSPPSSPFPLPFRQDFDHENISAPPAYWCELQHLTMDPLSSLPVVLCGRRYDQMGAWEVQADPTKPGARHSVCTLLNCGTPLLQAHPNAGLRAVVTP